MVYEGWKTFSVCAMTISIFFQIYDLTRALFSTTVLGTISYSLLFGIWVLVFYLNLVSYRNWVGLGETK